MSVMYCQYHQQTPARWTCNTCHSNVCNSCVNDQIDAEAPLCVLCNEPLSDNGLEDFIPPFWAKMSLFFSIPLSLPALSFIAFMLITGNIALYLPLIGVLVVTFVLPTVFLKYAYLLLENVSDGRMQAPSIGDVLRDNDYSIVFKQVGVFFLLFAPLTYIASTSPILGILFLFLVILLIPATVMVLSVTQSFFQTLNPLTLLSFATRIGWSYLLLYLLMTIINSGPAIILEFVMSTLSEQTLASIIIPLFLALEMYFTLVIFAVLGYVLFKYHHRLGFKIDSAHVEALEGFQKPPFVHPALKDIEVLIKEGQHQKALDLLIPRMSEHQKDAEVMLRFHKLLVLNHSPDLLKYAVEFIHMLLSTSNRAYAVTVFKDCLATDKTFKLTYTTDYVPLCETMLQIREYKLLVHLLNGFHKTYPEFEHIGKLYLMMAKALSEGLGEDAKALNVLQFVLKHYPNQEAEIQTQLNTCLQEVTQLLAAAKV